MRLTPVYPPHAFKLGQNTSKIRITGSCKLGYCVLPAIVYRALHNTRALHEQK